MVLNSLGIMSVRASPPDSLNLLLGALPLANDSKKNGISSGASIYMLIWESLSLNRFGVRPSIPVIPLENESMIPFISVRMYS